MCKFSHIFQDQVKRLSSDELSQWFHNFVKNTISENIHKDCEKRIDNLKNMIKAVSGNNLVSINDLEYSRKNNARFLLNFSFTLLKFFNVFSWNHSI